MTIIRMGRKESKTCMEFEFPNAMDAFVFYAGAKDSYREDDLVIEMTEGEDEE